MPALRNRLLQGLSPRVRGSHDREADIVLATRSIPAGAGEPGVEHHG